MNAVVIREHGGFDKLLLEERPTPAPRAREVRVQVKAVGLNHMDVWVRRGVPGHTFPLPLVPGSDAAGVVDAVGADVTNVAVGDEVVVLPGVADGTSEACLLGNDQLSPDYGILGESRDGCCAEFVVVPDQNVAARPQNISFSESAAFGLAFQTAWSMLVVKARLQPGETVLIHGGGSGVGSGGIQIAKLLGAEVIATAGTDTKCSAALALGADHAINYQDKDFVAEVRALRGRAGVDVVFEHIGGETFAGSMKCLTRGGRLVTCGATAGGEATINLRQVFFKNLEILGNTMGSKGDLRRIIRLVGQGQLRPVVDRVLPLDQVAEAHRLLEAREAFGKIVLEP
ncbi:MAG: zinc-binding dehydrogenase [Planctomycetota bacterium]|jgi:NADPH:quinone reductase-like Zn-dependent oxidoreductase